jgi:restriction system protein
MEAFIVSWSWPSACRSGGNANPIIDFMKLNQNSLFAVLLRSPWWASALAAVGLVAGLRFWLPELYALFAALPFIVIAALVGWRQLREPSARRIAGTIERLRAMSWEELAGAVEAAFRREGYTVKRLGDGRADFELVQGPRITLVACKRWKATRTGIEPLRELEAARSAQEAHACIYVAAGEVTEQARAFAVEKKMRLVHDAELVKLMG